ncbi:MAG: macro domain-containing protein [Thaumarchaeota archaeon]|nr:macro domain-containing protein [Nitrososphaerota archaeon]
MIKIKNTIIELVQGDITELNTDALVNSANSKLHHGGGVAWAIINKGGYSIQKESEKLGFCPVGNAVITFAGKLKAKYVIHAVGPRMGEGNEDVKLNSAISSTLNLADKHKLKSIAFTAISTGIYKFPVDRCADIMLNTTIEYCNKQTNLQKIVFCLYDEKTFKIFKNTLECLT